MQFNYVLVAFASRGAPLSLRTLKNRHTGFAPLSLGDGLIYTVDTNLWSGRIGGESRAFCPDHLTIAQAMEHAANDNCYFVVALTHLADFDPPGSSDLHLPLVHWTQIIEESINNIQLTEVGFDVADQWTGISGLSNMGYNAKDVLTLKDTRLQVNQFGLFDTEEDAFEFASLVNVIAPEHAPFVPLRTLVRIPVKGA